ncbi:MAG TPA: DUF2905 domain-containing protein [Candidatus Xenobia bacterium]|nr:DUF2905 domain-containing protein [Candidatus Xenobia bacterium]
MGFDSIRELGRALLLFGLVLAGLGLLLMLGPKLAGRLGRLPGDIVIRGENFTFYFPLVTCLLVSAILSLLFWLFSRR